MAAAVGGEEPEYESDPEEALLPSLRRREASDDEEGSDSGCRSVVQRESDVESDGQGGAPGYEDEEEEVVEEDLLEEEFVSESGGKEVVVVEEEYVGEDGRGDGGEEEGGVGEEKKENEPFAVPTAGAFYMHDNRFREGRGGRNRHTLGGRRLWESKDDRSWVHDRFEEMRLQDVQYNERRNTRGRYRGRGRGRGSGRGRGRGNRSRSYDDETRVPSDIPQGYNDRSGGQHDRSKDNDEKRNPNHAPKTVRGRGPRRYDAIVNDHKEIPASRKKQVDKSHEQASSIKHQAKQPSQTPNAHYEPVVPRKQVLSSNLNVSSPPFYPSGSSSQEASVAPTRGVQTGESSRNDPTMSDNNFSPSNSSTTFRGKSGGTYGAQSRPHADNPIHQTPGRLMGGMPTQSVGTTQPPHLRLQEGGISPQGAHFNYQQNLMPNQVGKASGHAQHPIQQRPGNTASQPVLRGSVSEVEDSESQPGSSKSKAMVGGKEKAISEGGGALLYNGAQFIGPNGTLGVGHGDQKFPGTPALLPVMQFSGQHHGGLGVPAVGMALPGYVAQPQLGLGSSEMAWLPMLAGAAGALGASYGPYITLDGGYHALSSGPASSAPTSKEAIPATTSNTWNAPQRSEHENDENGQRQNKPRRYSEMNFGQ